MTRGHASAVTGRYDRHVTESEVYGAIGEAGFSRLVGAFYAQVPGDDILGPMYPAGIFRAPRSGCEISSCSGSAARLAMPSVVAIHACGRAMRHFTSIPVPANAG